MEDKYSSKKPYLPNTKLRNERRNRGWTLGVLADKIELPDHHTIGRWERGEQATSLHYCQKLVEVFGKSMEELGLPTAKDEGAPVLLPTPHAGPIYNIPHLLTPLIGRDQEVAEVCALLTHSDPHLVTLLGTGGIGKTRLAIQVATQIRDHFSAGVCLVSLSAITDPVQVIPAIASELTLWENDTLPLLEQLKFFLFDKNLLLVLDNFEHVVAAAPSIEILINSCPHLKVLVTSRHVLKLQGGKNFSVSPLPLPDSTALPEPETLKQNASIALFIQCTQAHQATFQLTEKNAQAIAQLCVRLDGLLLAIELAASRMQLSSPQNLLTRLPQSLLTLKNDADTVPERQRTLYSLIKWSYDLLDAQDQWLFRHLSVFAGPTSLETIENFFSTGEQPLVAIEDRVLSLLNKSLLKHTNLADDDFRIMMLGPIREFGLDCLRNNRELEELQKRIVTLRPLSIVSSAPESNHAIEIFISYDSEDEELLEALRVHLGGLRYLSLSTDWYNQMIPSGADQQREIDAHLNTAQIILLLISPAYLASNSCKAEMYHAIKQHEAGTVRAVPVLLRLTKLKGTLLENLSVLPTNAKPVTRWKDRDEAFVDITKSIRVIIEDLYAKQEVKTQTKSLQLHEQLKYQREQRGWSQAELASQIKYSVTTVAQWESGKVAPRPKSMRKLLRVFGISPEELGINYTSLEVGEVTSEYTQKHFDQDVYTYLSYLDRTYRFLKLLGVVPRDLQGDPELSNLFVQPYLTIQSPASSPSEVQNDLIAVLDSFPHLVLLGDPGSGKSVIIRYLAWSYAQARLSPEYVANQKLALTKNSPIPDIVQT